MNSKYNLILIKLLKIKAKQPCDCSKIYLEKAIFAAPDRPPVRGSQNEPAFTGPMWSVKA